MIVYFCYQCDDKSINHRVELIKKFKTVKKTEGMFCTSGWNYIPPHWLTYSDQSQLINNRGINKLQTEHDWPIIDLVSCKHVPKNITFFKDLFQLQSLNQF